MYVYVFKVLFLEYHRRKRFLLLLLSDFSPILSPKGHILLPYTLAAYLPGGAKNYYPRGLVDDWSYDWRQQKPTAYKNVLETKTGGGFFKGVIALKTTWCNKQPVAWCWKWNCIADTTNRCGAKCRGWQVVGLLNVAQTVLLFLFFSGDVLSFCHMSCKPIVFMGR